MYKIWNKLFGWDYVQWSNCADSGIARVHVDAEGRPFYWRYRVIKVADRINRKGQVVWLTCKPEKYLD